MLLEEREIILCIDETESGKGKDYRLCNSSIYWKLVSIQATYFQLQAKSNQQSTFEIDTSVNQIPAYN